jgi:hypothetical protein
MSSPTTQITINKGPEGVGMYIGNTGKVLDYTGTGGPAERAGVPLQSTIVSVNGTAVATKADIVSAVQACAHGGDLTFVLRTDSPPPESIAATPILKVLKKARLEQHVEAFREMGCVELADLADMNFPDTPFLRKLEFKRLMRVTIRTCIIILFTFLKSRATNIRMTGPGINLALPHHLDVVLNQLLCQEAGCSADVVARKVAHVSTREAQAVKVEPRPQPAAEVNLTDTSDAILMIELVSGSAIDLRESIGIAAGLPGMLG